MHVIGYLRVSSAMQARSGLGLEAQRSAITGWAKASGHTVEWMADEGESAKSTDRPGLQLALSALADRKADAIVVSKLDRLSRSVHDFSGLLEVAQRQRWGIVALDMGIDTSTMTGRLVAHILVAVSAWEREAIAGRTSDAIQERLARGESWGRTPDLPEATAELIAELSREGHTNAAITRRLNADGVPTARGGTWHPSTVSRVLARLARVAVAAERVAS